MSDAMSQICIETIINFFEHIHNSTTLALRLTLKWAPVIDLEALRVFLILLVASLIFSTFS